MSSLQAFYFVLVVDKELILPVDRGRGTLLCTQRIMLKMYEVPSLCMAISSLDPFSFLSSVQKDHWENVVFLTDFRKSRNRGVGDQFCWGVSAGSGGPHPCQLLG